VLTVNTENKSKAMQGSTAGGQHYSVPVAAGVGADPINALQNLSKQPVPAAMAQQGDCHSIDSQTGGKLSKLGNGDF